MPITVPELELLVLPELPEEFLADSVVDFVPELVLLDPELPEFVFPDFVPELPVEAEFELLPELFLEEFPELLFEELLPEFLFPPLGLPCPPRPGPP